MKRMGGGFGGKETRSVFIACTVALAAHILNKPVRINVERDVDMMITGQRHAFQASYRASVVKEGDEWKLNGLDVRLYNNAGCSLDLSSPVCDRSLFHIDNSYKWKYVKAQGLIAKTNQPSHTAYRGFGGPQGMFICENIIDHLYREICSKGYNGSNLESIADFRESNLYVEGERTPFGQPLIRWNVPHCWQRLKKDCDYENRKLACEKFNAENTWRKRGVAMMPTKFGINFTAKFMNQGGALVHVYQDGTVLVSHGGTEMGQGLHMKVMQVAARVFNIDVSRVHIQETATDKVANSSPTAASMSTDLYGMACLDACDQSRNRLEN